MYIVAGNTRCARSTVPKLVDMPKFAIRYYIASCRMTMNISTRTQHHTTYQRFLRHWPVRYLDKAVCRHARYVERPRRLVVRHPCDIRIIEPTLVLNDQQGSVRVSCTGGLDPDAPRTHTPSNMAPLNSRNTTDRSMSRPTSPAASHRPYTSSALR